MPLNFSYEASQVFCKEIGLTWHGEEYPPLVEMDAVAKKFDFTQEQINEGMRHHLWQVRQLFNPKNYTLLQRIAMAFYFLTGVKPK